MDEIVECGADAGVEKIAEHEEVGGEEEECEEEPAVVEVLVGEEGGEEEDGFFCAEQEGGAGSMDDLYGIRGDRSRVAAKGEADSLAALRMTTRKNCKRNGNGESRSSALRRGMTTKRQRHRQRQRCEGVEAG